MKLSCKQFTILIILSPYTSLPGNEIRRQLRIYHGDDASSSAFYETMGRLERKKLITGNLDKKHKYYRITELGKDCLAVEKKRSRE